jgi:Rrf2 family protein
MKISQKLEYACRAMTQLAKYHDGRTLTRLEDLAQREAVSGNFLVQILNDLRRAGLVESRRGKAGGYLLARGADQITLRQVVEAVDPSLLQCSVTREGDSGQAVRFAWDQVSSALQESLGEITLESLASKQGAPMFYI